MIKSCFYERPFAIQLNVQAAIAEKEKIYTVSNIHILNFKVYLFLPEVIKGSPKV